MNEFSQTNRKYIQIFIKNIADNYNIPFHELYKDFDNASQNTCMHKVKNRYCKNKDIGNGYCSKHQSAETLSIGVLIDKVKPKKETISKTRAQLLEMLNTVTPRQETVLKRCALGLLDENTDIVFDDAFVAIGKANGTKLVPLEEFEIGICDKNNWRYQID